MISSIFNAQNLDHTSYKGIKLEDIKKNVTIGDLVLIQHNISFIDGLFEDTVGIVGFYGGFDKNTILLSNYSTKIFDKEKPLETNCFKAKFVPRRPGEVDYKIPIEIIEKYSILKKYKS